MEFFDRMKSKVYRSGPDKPIDVTQAIRQAMDRGATPMSRERTVAPNHFEISISPETDAAFEQWGKEALLQEFVRDANAYATEQNYSLTGSVYVEFTPLNPEQRRLEVKARSVSGARPVSGSEPGIPAESVLSPSQPKPHPAPAQTPASENLEWKPVESAAPDVPANSVGTTNPQESELLAKHEQKPLLEVVGGQTYLLVGERTVVGRGRNVDIALSDSGVSHQHFEIVQVGTNYVLRDLGSTNGTFVEGNRVNEATLLDRNVVTAGRIKMIFWRQAAPPQES
ncbi:FhaA domain-containing protein [Mobiluncus curtisii]|uniref:FhaA domain-containing protein n=1 Tax=Mobiluncus curtisii TaxID=2051 RepID=UPI0017B56766|nr:FhaA domain-containing protein [Mobiluncus curtisii]NMW83954.1 DUF3662 domain-containing protein [Mobiluncus curtisii]